MDKIEKVPGFSNNSSGLVVWVTGLSGAGKTTISHLLIEKIRDFGRVGVLLDGDILRYILGQVSSHSEQDRLGLAQIYGRLCQELAYQGFDVVCATISMFDSVREWNRNNISNYYEVYLKVPLHVLQMRDPKKLYSDLLPKDSKKLVGVADSFEEPKRPDLIINNYNEICSQKAANMIFEHLKEKAFLEQA